MNQANTLEAVHGKRESGKTQRLTVLRGLAVMFVVLATVAPLTIVITNQNSRPSTTTMVATVTQCDQQAKVNRAPASSANLDWTYNLPEATLLIPPVTADLFNNGKQEVVFVAPLNREIYCLNGTTGTLLWNYTTGNWFNSRPVLADLLGNGKKEVIGSFDDDVYCLNGTTGSKLWVYATGSLIQSSPVVADIYENGKQEVVVGSDGVYCLNGTTGSQLWNCSTAGFIFPSPVVADSGEGKKVVIAGSFDKSVYCLDAKSGSILWSFKTGGPVEVSPIVADLLGDGKEEVILWSSDNKTYCLDCASGTSLWNCTIPMQYSGYSYLPLAADFAGNGKREVLLWSLLNGVYCLNGTTGTKMWNYTNSSTQVFSVVTADVLESGKQEVLVGGWDGVYCWNGITGDEIWDYPVNRLQGGSSPTLVTDLYGDGRLEVIVGVDGIYCLEGSTGSKLWNYTTPGIHPTPSVAADLNGDGRMEIVSFSEGSNGSSVFCISPPPQPNNQPAIVLVSLGIIGAIAVAGVAVILKIRSSKKNSK